ncbi:hypothetical protein Cgig2_003703 [Carnegiea gigantea]|uniref:HMG box domain-containing protein n=1 Tax=Carnegiea gigantea TaxID=171969 RepID=A0A9Q1KGW9_9CARY|nr:hypothetical protein Cgig2_003703 [Carnegiea gigantea]
MANPQRNRKRVRALRRAPDGSAFQNDECGSSVPVALMDMHECQGTKDVKKDVRIMGKCEPPVVKQMSPSDEPRSAFQFFLESYMKSRNDEDLVEVNREAFDKWKKMSDKEQWPYIQQAEKVERAYMKVIREEVNHMSQGSLRVMMKQIQEWLGSLLRFSSFPAIGSSSYHIVQICCFLLSSDLSPESSSMKMKTAMKTQRTLTIITAIGQNNVRTDAHGRRGVYGELVIKALLQVSFTEQRKSYIQQPALLTTPSPICGCIIFQFLFYNRSKSTHETHDTHLCFFLCKSNIKILHLNAALERNILTQISTKMIMKSGLINVLMMKTLTDIVEHTLYQQPHQIHNYKHPNKEPTDKNPHKN